MIWFENFGVLCRYLTIFFHISQYFAVFRSISQNFVSFRFVSSIIISLQKDIDNLLAWSNDWKMDFNADKCKVLRITNKKSPVATIYSMLGEELEVVVHHPYLGIELDSNLSWNSHVT